MNKLEAKFQTEFGKWLRNNWKESSAFELKISKYNESLPVIRILQHQFTCLSIAANNLLYYKIPDVGYDQKPFDCFTLWHSGAYFVFHWIRPKNKVFYIIDAEYFRKYINDTHLKSIDELIARSLAVRVGKIN